MLSRGIEPLVGVSTSCPPETEGVAANSWPPLPTRTTTRPPRKVIVTGTEAPRAALRSPWVNWAVPSPLPARMVAPPPATSWLGENETFWSVSVTSWTGSFPSVIEPFACTVTEATSPEISSGRNGKPPMETEGRWLRVNELCSSRPTQ